MTEAEWLLADEPAPLLLFLSPRADPRRLRLFLCGCVRHRHQAGWLVDRFEATRAAVELAEGWADGLVEQADVFQSGLVRSDVLPLFSNEGQLRHMAAEAHLVRRDPPFTESKPERAARAGIVREIFGNPFRPVSFEAVWRTSTSVQLARQMYETREFGAMPILADALQDAGCDNEAVLDHCRDPKASHVRGCWVVDLVLGKS